MIDSTPIVSQTQVTATSRRCVPVPCVDSTTLASQTPAQASQSHNVRKCPVLSGPTDPPEETNASPDSQTTCAKNPSRPDRTSTGHHPAQPPFLAFSIQHLAFGCSSHRFVVNPENNWGFGRTGLLGFQMRRPCHPPRLDTLPRTDSIPRPEGASDACFDVERSGP